MRNSLVFSLLCIIAVLMLSPLPAAAESTTFDGSLLEYLDVTRDGAGPVVGPGGIGSDSLPSDILWQKTLGGSKDEKMTMMGTGSTDDGGFILAATTKSGNGNVLGYHGGEDIWIVKLRANRTIEWQKCLGGSGNETLSSLKEMDDGGYLVLGTTTSTNGDVTGNHGGNDIWIVRLNPNGTIAWQKCLGGSGEEDKPYIQIFTTIPGNYLIAATTTSNNGDVSGNHGGRDLWLARFNLTSRSLVWQRCLGGSRDDYARGNMFVQGTENNLIVAGITESDDGDVKGNHGGSDVWLLKLFQNRTLAWQRCIGGSNNETETPQFYSTADGGYLVAGQTESNDGDISGNHGNLDAFVIKLNATRGVEWERTIGGSGDDLKWVFFIRDDGKIGLYGSTYSTNGDMAACHGNRDFFGTVLFPNGTPGQVRCFGGSREDEVKFGRFTKGVLMQALIATNSTDGDVKANHGANDIFLADFNPDGTISRSHCLGGSADDWPSGTDIISSGDYYVFGYTSSNDGDVSGNHGMNDLWIARFNLTRAQTDAALTVTIPDGGQNWKQGTTQTLRWIYTGYPGLYVRLELLKGPVVNRVITTKTSTGSSGYGTFSWKVPFNQGLGTDYRIRVTSITFPSVNDTSNANFNISAGAPLTVTVPNGGQVWSRSSTRTIAWTYTGSPGSFVKIDLLKGSAVSSILFANTSIGSGGTGSKNWTVPALQTPGSDYRIRVTSLKNALWNDTSNANFTIT